MQPWLECDGPLHDGHQFFVALVLEQPGDGAYISEFSMIRDFEEFPGIRRSKSVGIEFRHHHAAAYGDELFRSADIGCERLPSHFIGHTDYRMASIRAVSRRASKSSSDRQIRRGAC